MNTISNHIGEQFALHIYDNYLDQNNILIPWWFKAEVKITINGETVSSALELLTTEDLILLQEWLEKLYTGKESNKLFQFADGHVWFRKWRKCNKPTLRFFILIDENTQYYWEWDYEKDVNQVFLGYIKALASKAKHLNHKTKSDDN